MADINFGQNNSKQLKNMVLRGKLGRLLDKAELKALFRERDRGNTCFWLLRGECHVYKFPPGTPAAPPRTAALRIGTDPAGLHAG